MVPWKTEKYELQIIDTIDIIGNKRKLLKELSVVKSNLIVTCGLRTSSRQEAIKER